jgi:molybdenum cofactor synthesis domain-containing protein
MHVAVIAVGDELLTGDTVNTNAAWLGTRLTERGATVDRAAVVPDRIDEIVDTISCFHKRYDAVLITGGLGPTPDDLTMDAVARAFDREVTTSEEAVEWLDTYDGYTGAPAADTTVLPTSARVLHNEEGVAPGCVVESVYVFPGIPTEMKPMFESVANEFTGTKKTVEMVHADEPESVLLDRIEVVRERFDVTVASHPGEHVRLKIQSSDGETATAAADWLREHVDTVDAPD